MALLWNLEDLVEDAFVAYLKAKCTGDLSVYAAFSTENLKYPCVVVHCAESDCVAKGAEWHKHREMAVDIAVICGADDMLDTSAGKLKTARERNAEVRSDVMNALDISTSATAPAGLSGLCQSEDMPKGLAAELTAMMIPGVWISVAIPGKIVRDVDESRRMFMTTISVYVIAQPVKIGGEPT